MQISTTKIPSPHLSWTLCITHQYFQRSLASFHSPHRGIPNHHHSPPAPLFTSELNKASNFWEKLSPPEKFTHFTYKVTYSHINPYLCIAGFQVPISGWGQTC